VICQRRPSVKNKKETYQKLQQASSIGLKLMVSRKKIKTKKRTKAAFN
jgi:hypothetical protein